jgi:hypothetical protein
MLNFRVENLDRMVSQLRDPEDNPIELWEPDAAAG